LPLFYQHNINEEEKLGIWKIEEDEQFFLSAVPLQRDISHKHKRLQHLAGRYLLQYLFPDFPYSLIKIADTRKPFLNNESYHFSISHCDNYAAALVSKNNRVGVDIELVVPAIEKIQHKFLSDEELTKIQESKLPRQRKAG
jgi:phosphopantetheinyl transferase